MLEKLFRACSNIPLPQPFHVRMNLVSTFRPFTAASPGPGTGARGTDSRFRIGVFIANDVARHVYTSRVPPETSTQELVRVLQRYVIYAIRRNDNGYLHGEHRETPYALQLAEETLPASTGAQARRRISQKKKKL